MSSALGAECYLAVRSAAQVAASKFNAKRLRPAPRGLQGWRNRLCIPVALGSGQAAAVAVLLTEDETLLRKTVSGICSVDWTACALDGEMHIKQLAQETTALVRSLPDTPNGVMAKDQGMHVPLQATTEETDDLVDALLQQRCLLLLRFGSEQPSKVLTWEKCYRRVYNKTAYQQAVFSVHREDIHADRGRQLLLPEDVALPPDCPRATEARLPSGSVQVGGQMGCAGAFSTGHESSCIMRILHVLAHLLRNNTTAM